MIEMIKTRQEKDDIKSIEALNAHINIITEADGNTKIFIHEKNPDRQLAAKNYFESKGYLKK